MLRCVLVCFGVLNYADMAKYATVPLNCISSFVAFFPQRFAIEPLDSNGFRYISLRVACVGVRHLGCPQPFPRIGNDFEGGHQAQSLEQTYSLRVRLYNAFLRLCSLSGVL